MDAFRHLIGLALVFSLLTLGQAQQEEDLALFTPVSGTLASGETDTWTFAAADGAMLSFDLRATIGDLDPQLTILNSNGSPLMFNDDRDHPQNQDPLLEAVSIPRTDSYAIAVSAFGSTSGSYELTMKTGFAETSQQVNFDDADLWTSNVDDMEMFFGNNRMALMIEGLQERAIATYTEGNAAADHYLRVEIPELSGPSGWRVGLVVRQQDNQQYYLYSLNESGQWQFTVNTAEGERILRDWSNHPAIIPGQTTFNLGILANGVGFEFFYNDQLIGRLSDDTLQDPGQFAVMIGTPATIGSELTAQFQNLTVTSPAADIGYPEQIQSGGSSVMVQELQRRRLIPASGQMGLLVPESFVTFNRPGVNELLLGGGDQIFRNFAFGATFSWDISAPELPAGCGLLLRAEDELDYLLAYVDQTGAYGLSPRQGDTFESGIYGDGLALAEGPQQLLVIADEDRLIYYVNGQLVGTLEYSAATGQVGNAVANFEAVTTSCQFSDSWVWAWE